MAKEIALVRVIRDNDYTTIDVKGKTDDLMVAISIALVDLEMSQPKELQAKFRSDFMEQLNHVREIRIREGKFS